MFLVLRASSGNLFLFRDTVQLFEAQTIGAVGYYARYSRCTLQQVQPGFDQCSAIVTFQRKYLRPI